jgi:hypothetical protein
MSTAQQILDGLWVTRDYMFGKNAENRGSPYICDNVDECIRRYGLTYPVARDICEEIAKRIEHRWSVIEWARIHGHLPGMCSDEEMRMYRIQWLNALIGEFQKKARE